MPRILITGANRGLGLELTRQYEADGWPIFACCRDPESADELRTLAEHGKDRITVHALDVTDPDRIDELSSELSSASIDVLFNNAGVYPDKGMGFGSMDYDAWRKAFEVNTFGPMRMAEAFVDQVARSDRKQIVNMTSKMGSVDDNRSGGSYAYRSSKAALNIVTKSLAVDLEPRGLTCVVVHPGWVRTDMGGRQAPLSIEESAAGLREVVDGLTPDDSGRFLGWDGEEIPW